MRRWGAKLSTFVNNLTFIPYLIPSMAFSAIYLSMFAKSHGPIPALYGTFALLIIIGTVKYLPMASRSGVNSMFQISAQIEEAAALRHPQKHLKLLAEHANHLLMYFLLV